MDEMNTATAIRTDDLFVGVDELNRLPLADVFIAIGPARVVAENVTVGPVEVCDRPGETKYLVRIEGRVDVLKDSEVEALEASRPQVLRYLARLAAIRDRAEAWRKDRAERAARVAACRGHEFVSQEIGRCLHYIECRFCGLGETVSSDG